jgi:Fur family ferric uptake transcriptional regulator
MSTSPAPLPEPWSAVPDRFRGRGLRWTAQRRVVVEVLAATDGHITSAELVDRCRALEPSTIPSTVYRTLDALEELGLVRHGHGADGREEFHVQPAAEHGHRYCAACGGTWEIHGAEAAAVRAAFDEAAGFEVDLSHVTIVGRCRGCRDARSTWGTDADKASP